MEELSQILKNNRTDDLTWFCSLSESELDLLISLKKLALQRTKISGHQELADKFDLKLLRALGSLLLSKAYENVALIIQIVIVYYTSDCSVKLSIFDLMKQVWYFVGLVLMEYARKRVQDDTCLAPNVVHQLRLLDNCNLLKTHVNDTVDIEEILTQIFIINSKRKARKRLVGVLNRVSGRTLFYSMLDIYAFLLVFEGGGRK